MVDLRQESRGENSHDTKSQRIKPLRILVVAPSYDILGGQAVQAARLLERLKNEPSLETSFLPINPRLPGALRKLQSIKYVRSVVTSILYVATLLNRVRECDVVHVFSASYLSFLLAPTPAILIGKLYRKKVLLNYHSGEAEDHLQRWHRSALPTMRLVDEIVVPSQFLVRVFAKFGLRAKAIYNLIETDQFRFRERQPLRPVFLSNRNFEVHYGVDRVLRAFAIIQRQLPEARLIVAGHGPELGSLERLARELRLENTIFHGRVGPERMPELYETSDIFLNGSEIDNQPLSILESFACGLPVVTTNAGGIVDMVENEKTGLVIEKGNYRAMAAAALRLLEDSALAQRIINQSQVESGKYTWPAVRDQWLCSYGQIAGGEGDHKEPFMRVHDQAMRSQRKVVERN